MRFPLSFVLPLLEPHTSVVCVPFGSSYCPSNLMGTYRATPPLLFNPAHVPTSYLCSRTELQQARLSFCGFCDQDPRFLHTAFISITPELGLQHPFLPL